jgi:hypothetical protein
MANPPVGMSSSSRHVTPDGVAPADASFEPFLLRAPLFHGDEIEKQVVGDVDKAMRREQPFDSLARRPAAGEREPVTDRGAFGALVGIARGFWQGGTLSL